MDAFFRSFPIKSFVLYSTIASFGLTSITPAHEIHLGYSAGAVNLAIAGVKIKNLIDKFEKHKESKNLDKMMDYMLEIKHEAELILGKSVNLDSLFDAIDVEIKKNGQKPDKTKLSFIKKLIKKKESKINHKVMFMANCIEMGIGYDAELEHLSFIAKHKEDKEKDIGLGDIPIDLSIGIVCCVCGGVLAMIPIPMSREIGMSLFGYGIQMVLKETLLDPITQPIKDEQAKNKKK